MALAEGGADASGLIDGCGGGDAYSGASLFLNFLSGTTLDSRVTFTRGTNATLLDILGEKPAATARAFGHADDGATLEQHYLGSHRIPVLDLPVH